MDEYVKVKFDKNGYYHPAYGRLGRGKNVDQIYEIPAAFAERETIEVDTYDITSVPPRVTGKRSITRYKHLPRSAEVLSDAMYQLLCEEARNDGLAPPSIVRAKPIDKAELERITGRGSVAPRQTAVERTTGRRRMPRSSDINAT